MELRKVTSARYNLTLHAYELATLVSAVRWISEGAEGTLSPEVVESMKQFVKKYETALEKSQQEELKE